MSRRRDDIGQWTVTVTVQAAGPLAGPAELLDPRPVRVVSVEVPPPGADRLVPVPEAGPSGWWAVVRGAVVGCWAPLSVLTLCGAGLPPLMSGSVAEAVVVVPVLTDVAGGAGLLLLPLIWLTVVAVHALLLAVCAAGVVAVITGWAADGHRPGARAVARLVGHRFGRLWAWLLLLHVAAQAVTGLPLWLLTGVGPWPSAPVQGLTGAVGWVLVAVSWASAVAAGLLAPVVLFERARGPRRALRLLTRGPRHAMVASALAAGVPVLVPALAGELSAGFLAGPAVVAVAIISTAAGTLFWLVAATVGYAAAAAVTSGATVLTAPFLKVALAADEA